MHEFYSALAIIENQTPRTRRDAIRQEEKFYADMAEASWPWRLFTAIVARAKAKSLTLVKKRDQGSHSTGCDYGQAKGRLPALALGAGDCNGVRATMCGSVHARAPDEKLNRPMPC
ncbi:hypothetical protein [Rhizobium sp. X9]|uniref:hypothetical protein n=1 Tax=Rhizobium sp. X9 TaxID=2815360 RepID=UPI001C0D13B3|nr:hypothetical protein [Rhizobium sp. X9]